MKYVEPLEAIKRLAAAQGIDVLNLIKTQEQLQQEMAQQQQQMQQQAMLEQAGQMAQAPMADPTKNPQLAAQLESGQEPQPPQE